MFVIGTDAILARVSCQVERRVFLCIEIANIDPSLIYLSVRRVGLLLLIFSVGPVFSFLTMLVPAHT